MQERKQNGHSSLIWALIKMNESRWKGNFIKFSMEQYFGICSVLYTGENPRKKRQQQHDENKIVEMRTTTTKRSLDNASIGPHDMKFRSLEKNKYSKSIGKRRHKLATSDARRC
jgi:hypothetical protein